MGYKFIMSNKKVIELNEKLNSMDECMNKEIIKLWLIEEKNCGEIFRMQKFISKQGKCISKRRVQQIIKDFYPDYSNGCGKKGSSSSKHYERFKLQKEAYKMSPEKYECALCGCKNELLELDHIIPLKDGGLNAKSNLRWLCHNCHIQKTVKETKEYQLQRKEVINEYNNLK